MEKSLLFHFLYHTLFPSKTIDPKWRNYFSIYVLSYIIEEEYDEILRALRRVESCKKQVGSKEEI